MGCHRSCKAFYMLIAVKQTNYGYNMLWRTGRNLSLLTINLISVQLRHLAVTLIPTYPPVKAQTYFSLLRRGVNLSTDSMFEGEGDIGEG
jgi:hypothetical protein